MATRPARLHCLLPAETIEELFFGSRAEGALMSDSSPYDLRPNDDEIVTARIVSPVARPTTNRRRFVGSLGFWLVLGGGSFVVIVFGTLLSLAVWLGVRREWEQQAADMSELSVLSDDDIERLVGGPIPPPLVAPEEHGAVFEVGPMSADAHGDYRSIVAFVSEISQIVQENESDKFYDEVDVSRYLARVRMFYHKRLMEHGARIEWRTARSRVRTYVAMPERFSEFQVMRIDELEADDRLVWLHLRTSPDEITPYRWWLVRSGSQWKLYDWESLEDGLTDALYTALIWGEPEARKQSAYFDWVRNMNDLADLREDETSDVKQRVESILVNCERLRVPTGLFGICRLAIARQWISFGFYERARRVLTEASKWEANTPGMALTHAYLLMREGEYAAALEKLETYRRYVGPTLEVLDAITTCQEQLRREDDVLQTRIAMLKYDDRPFSGTLFEIVTRLPGDQTRSLLEQLATTDRGRSQIRVLARQLLGESVVSRELRQVRDALAQNEIDPLLLLLCEAALRVGEGKTEEGTQALVNAVKSARHTDGEAAADDLAMVVSVARELGLWNRLLQQVAADAKLLHVVFDDYVGSRSEKSAQALLEVADAILAKNPDHPEALAARVCALADTEPTSETFELLRRALDLLDRESVMRDEVRYHLIQYCLDLRRWDVLEQLAQADDVTSWVIGAARHEHDPEVLKRMMGWVKEQPLVHAVFRALILRAEGRPEDAKKLLVSALNETDEAAYRWSATSLLWELHDQDGDWSGLLESTWGRSVAAQAVSRLLQRGDWKALDTLASGVLELERLPRAEVFPEGGPDWREIRFRSLVAQNRDKEAVEIVLQHPDPAISDDVLIRAVEAALRVDSRSAAESLLQAIRDPQTARYGRAKLALANGDTDRLPRLLSSMSEYQLTKLLEDLDESTTNDPTIRWYLRRHAPLLPWRLPDAWNTVRMLVDQEIAVEDVVDEALIQGVLGGTMDTEASLQRVAVPPGENAAVFSAPPYRVAVSLAEARPIGRVDTGDRRLDEAIRQGRFVLVVSVVEQRSGESDANASWLAFRLASRLADHGVLAVCYRGAWLRPEELTDDPAKRGDVYRMAFWKPGITMIPVRTRSQLEPALSFRFRSDLLDAYGRSEQDRATPPDAEADHDPERPFFVDCPMEFGGIRERIRSRVVSVQRNAGDEPILVVEVEATPRCSGVPRAGQVVRLELNRVVAWEWEGRKEVLSEK